MCHAIIAGQRRQIQPTPPPPVAGCGGGGPPAGNTGNPRSVGPRPAAGGEGMPADAGSRVVAPAPAAAQKLGAGGPAGGQVLPFLVSHVVNFSGLVGRASGARPCVLTASDKSSSQT